MRIQVAVVFGVVVFGGGAVYAQSDAALSLGPGTTFTTLSAMRAPTDRTLFLLGGDALPELSTPVGSCRLHFRSGVSGLSPGDTFRVRSVSTASSPHRERGISTVEWRFSPSDPVDTLVCDTVGDPGPTEYDVRWSMEDLFSIAPALKLSDG